MKKISTFFTFFLLISFASQKISAATNFVGKFGAPSGNYYTNIQSAVNAAYGGDFVFVSNGIYHLSQQINVTNNLTIQSVNGPKKTIINGNHFTRCFNLYNHNAILSGFSITNGYYVGVLYGGGGILCNDNTPVITNCIISGNIAKYGGGIYQGTLDNCIVSKNFAYEAGGGTYQSILNNCILNINSAKNGGGTSQGIANNCIINSNSASNGGGTFGGTIDNCIISSNSATSGGGGNCGSIIFNSTVIGNTALYGGGTYQGIVSNCIISGNSAKDGGGTYQSEVNNAIVIENMAEQDGGGTCQGTINNCTIIGNSARFGGGTCCATLNNCIIYYNSAQWGTNRDSGIYNYCCTTKDGTYGIGNIVGPPQLVDTNNSSSLLNRAGGFRLKLTSPCIDAGTNAFAPMPYDLAGNPRILHITVDMGAYEYVWIPQIATNALIFPAENSMIFASMFTNIIWDVEKITDDIDGTNLTISKINLHYADTTNYILEVTNNIQNTLGEIEWYVPPGIWDGQTNYVLKFEVVDSTSLTNSRIFWDNEFIIVPEPGAFGAINSYLLLVLGICRKLIPIAQVIDPGL